MTTLNHLNSGFHQIAVADTNGNITGVTLTGKSVLGNVSNITINGGTNAQFLQTDGNGNLQWTTVSTSSIVNGNSNVVVAANSNVTMGVAGNANIFTVTGTGVNVAGTLTATGNVSVSNITANGVANLGNIGSVKISGGNMNHLLQTDGNGSLSWIAPPSTSTILNGNSNVTVAANGNVTTSVAGNANIFTVTDTGVNVAGTTNISGALTVQANGANITGNVNVAGTMNSTSGLVVQANGASITGNVNVNGNLNVVGNVSAANVVNLVVDASLVFLANANPGDVLDIGLVGEYNDGTEKYTGIARNHNTGAWQVYTDLDTKPNSTVDFTSAQLGEFTAGATEVTELVVTGTANIANLNLSDDLLANNITANSNLASDNLAVTSTANIGNLKVTGNTELDGNLIANGNTSVANLSANGVVELGNVSNVKITGGSNLQFLQTDGVGNLTWATLATIANGNSNVNIADANGNVTISARGNANIFTVTDTGVNVAGTLNVTGNVTGANLISSDQLSGNLLFLGNSENNTSSKFRITSVGNTSYIQTGNGVATTGGNIVFSAYLELTPRLTINTNNGSLTATGNITANNIFTPGGVSATGNVSGNSLTAINQVFANGNITGGNLLTSGAITATGNIIGGNLFATGNIAGLTSLFIGNLADSTATKIRINNSGTTSYIQTGNGTFNTTGNIVFSPFLDTTQRVAINTATGNLTAGNLLTTGIVAATGNITTSGTFIGNGSGLTGVTAIVSSSWSVPVGNSTQSFTVAPGNTYFMWVECNIPNGILSWCAMATISNTNVPVVGVQYAWVYNGGGTPIDFTSIPSQFIGTANTIVRSSTSPSATTNKFEFGIRNSTALIQTVRYGYIKMS
jgi:filamentous hemagglutinin